MYFHPFKKYTLPALIILISFFAVNTFFQLTENLDNKYSSRQPPAYDGAVTLDADWMAGRPVTPLVYGWEWKVQNPDSHTSGNYRKTFIGQHGSFAQGSVSAAPYGQASYRLTLNTPGQAEPYLLLLPEVFSACKVLINGETVRTLGDTDREHYRPFVKNVLISVPSGQAMIEITASNYSHYYSGMTYPPLFGSVDTIENLVTRQLVLYGFLCFFTLGSAVISFALWATHREKQLYLLYGLLSLCFSAYISYPLTRFAGISHVRLFYMLEDASFYGMILCIVLITQLLTGNLQKKPHQLISAVCLFFCLLPGITSFLLAPMISQWITVSGYLIQLYKLAVSLYLFFMAVVWSFKSRQAFWLLTANSVFAMGILRDCLTAGLFEPTYGLWQTEYTSFFLVLIFMVVVIRHYRLLVMENTRLTRHLEEEVEKKTGYLTILLNERRQLLSSIAHDMKAPIAVIQAYIDLIHTGNVQIDGATDEYISIISRKSSSLAEQINTLQSFQEDAADREPPADYPLSGFLQEIFDETGIYAEAKGIYFHTELPETSAVLHIQRSRLLHAMENLILNATEHTPCEGSITLKCRVADGRAFITVLDTGCGISSRDLPHIFDYRFSGKSEAEKNGAARGLGLYFARAAVIEHGGTVNVRSEPGKGSEFTVILPVS